MALNRQRIKVVPSFRIGAGNWEVRVCSFCDAALASVRAVACTPRLPGWWLNPNVENLLPSMLAQAGQDRYEEGNEWSQFGDGSFFALSSLLFPFLSQISGVEDRLVKLNQAILLNGRNQERRYGFVPWPQRFLPTLPGSGILQGTGVLPHLH